jgi:integrase
MTPRTLTEKRKPRNLRKLNEQNVLKLPVQKRRPHYAWDSGTDAARGLGVLVLPSGTKSYRVTFYFPGSSKPHSMHLGRVGEMSLADARKRARAARERAREGFDPKAEDATRSSDFKSVVEDYIRQYQIGERENITAGEVQRVLLKACVDWYHRPIATIRAEEIGKLVRDIGNGTKPRKPLANKVFTWLQSLFSWCARPEIRKLKVSPMIGMKKPFKERQRERHFNDDEIKALWRAADEITGTEGRFLKALLLTGKRKGALSRMKWEHINGQWFWEPPSSESTKNKKLLPVPLSSLMQRVLGPRQARGYVFAGPVENTHYIEDGVLLRKVRRVSGISDFYPHALRHTVETQMAALRVPPHIRDLLLDHKPARGSGTVYDHHQYGEEMREGIELWAQHVERLVTPEGVRVLR